MSEETVSEETVSEKKKGLRPWVELVIVLVVVGVLLVVANHFGIFDMLKEGTLKDRVLKSDGFFKNGAVGPSWVHGDLDRRMYPVTPRSAGSDRRRFDLRGGLKHLDPGSERETINTLASARVLLYCNSATLGPEDASQGPQLNNRPDLIGFQVIEERTGDACSIELSRHDSCLHVQ